MRTVELSFEEIGLLMICLTRAKHEMSLLRDRFIMETTKDIEALIKKLNS